jgi:hypothetical protein
MSRESNTHAHVGKTSRDRKGMPAFHGQKGGKNRKQSAKLERRLKDWTETINRLSQRPGAVTPTGGWPTAYHRPGSYQ